MAGLAAVVVVAAGTTPGGPPAGAAAGPTLTVSPPRADPGDPVTVTISGCTDVAPTGPQVSYVARFDDVLLPLSMAEGPAGVWTGTAHGADDLEILSSCDGVELSATVDIDTPRLLPMPWGPPGDLPDPPESYLGTDCPDGTDATVTFAPAGLDPIVVGASTNALGDWTVTVPALPAGTVVTVDASCGSVTYPTTSYVAGGRDSVTTSSTPTSTSVPATAPLAPPAVARPGRATFTG